MNVLVVDDNATSRDIFQEMLKSFSFGVTLAASGQEGLMELEKASESQPFELVIMDWRRDAVRLDDKRPQYEEDRQRSDDRLEILPVTVKPGPL